MMEEKKEEVRIPIKKETGHKKKDGDILCKRCNEPFDPYEKIKYRKTGEKALSTCTHCGFVMKVSKTIPSTEYVQTDDGWKRKTPKDKLSKKERRKARKAVGTLAFKMEN